MLSRKVVSFRSFTDAIEASSTAAFVETILRQPLTAVQVYTTNNSVSPIEASRALWRMGGISKLYEGVEGFGLAFFGMRLPHRVGTFAINDTLNGKVNNVAIASLATVYESITTNVAETLLTQAQSTTSKDMSVPLSQRFQKLIAEKGLMGITSGRNPLFLRNAVLNFFGLTVGNTFPELKDNHLFVFTLSTIQMGVVLGHPFEVIRARQAVTDESMCKIASDIFKNQGVKGFSRGLGVRLGSVGICFTTCKYVYERLLQLKKESEE